MRGIVFIGFRTLRSIKNPRLRRWISGFLHIQRSYTNDFINSVIGMRDSLFRQIDFDARLGYSLGLNSWGSPRSRFSAMNAFLKREYVITDPTNITRAFSAAFEVADKLTSTHAVRHYPIDEEMALEKAMRSAVVARSSLRQNGQKPYVSPSPN